MNFGFQFVGFLWAVVTVPLATLLLMVAATWDGRMFAVAVICAGIAPLLSALGRALDRRRWRRGAAALGILFVVLSIILMARAPTGQAVSAAKVQHCYTGGDSHFSRFSLGNILPEVDQLMLGFTLMTVVDPLLTAQQSVSLKAMTRQIYRELEADPDFHALGSTMTEVYDEILERGIHAGNTYLYIPPGLDRTRPAPVLVFLHGSGGNFKAYSWVLSRLAERQKLVLLAPSFGMGNWTPTGTEQAVHSALQAAAQQVKLDSRAIHLMGLSNGGLGVSQLLGSQNSLFRSFIFLSPVFDRTHMITSASIPQIAGKPIFILTGAIDDRIPLGYVQTCAADLEHVGARVRLESVPDANHFLIFSHQEKMLSELEAWLNSLSKSEP